MRLEVHGSSKIKLKFIATCKPLTQNLTKWKPVQYVLHVVKVHRNSFHFLKTSRAALCFVFEMGICYIIAIITMNVHTAGPFNRQPMKSISQSQVAQNTLTWCSSWQTHTIFCADTQRMCVLSWDTRSRVLERDTATDFSQTYFFGCFEHHPAAKICKNSGTHTKRIPDG